jgi:hypothetical protein
MVDQTGKRGLTCSSEKKDAALCASFPVSRRLQERGRLSDIYIY